MNKLIPALKFTGIGFYIVTCIAGGALLGWWLGDKKPICVIGGLVLGIILAFFGLYRMIKPLLNNGSGKEND